MIGIGIDGRAERRRTGIEGRTPRTVNQVHLDVGMRRCEAGQAATREKKAEDKKTERLMGKKSRTKREGRTIPLDAESQTAMRAQFEAFRKKFGREIGPADPVFFDPDSDTPKPIPEDLIRRQMAEAMANAGISPEKVYAASKTGMLPTAENMHLWSAANLAEWNAAIEEYRKLTEGTKQ